MYDAVLLQDAMARQGLTYNQIANLANVDRKTAKSVIETGRGTGVSVYRVAKALGFPVKANGKPGRKLTTYDLRPVMKRRIAVKRRERAELPPAEFPMPQHPISENELVESARKG